MNPSPMSTGRAYIQLSEEQKAQEQLYSRTVWLDTRECKLPEPLEPVLFTNPPWDVQCLMQSKQNLNCTKSKLDTVVIGEWGKHTTFTNRAGLVVPKLRDELAPEMCTIAWAKMYEMLVFQHLLPEDSPAAGQSSPGAPPQVFTLHLCEAPGAFVCATNHFIRMERPSWNWDWRAITLNPYYEGNDQGAMIEDDALIRTTRPKWVFGADNTGDIRKQENIEFLWSHCHGVCEAMGIPGAIMVTADGSIDCQEDPNEQERHTAPLHYCELVTALGMLAPGGSFVLKAFTLLEHPSLCALYIMGCLFDQVAVTKPSPSKPGNSETYIIGKGYRGVSPGLLSLLLHHVSMEDMFKHRSMFDRSVLGSGPFMQSAKLTASIFAAIQQDIIEENLRLKNFMSKNVKQELIKAKHMLAQQWVYDMGLILPNAAPKILDESLFLGEGPALTGRDNNTSNLVMGNKRQKTDGTLEERKRFYEQRRITQQGGPAGAADGSLALPGASHKQGRREGGGVAGPEGSSEPAPFQPGNKVAQMMAKMGHEEGMGLGREGQGITQPVKNIGEGKLKKGLGYQAVDAGDPLHGLGGGGDMQPAKDAVPDTSMLCNDQLLEPLTELQSTHGWIVEVQARPPQLRRSKYLPEQNFLQLKAARSKAACQVHRAAGGDVRRQAGTLPIQVTKKDQGLASIKQSGHAQAEDQAGEGKQGTAVKRQRDEGQKGLEGQAVKKEESEEEEQPCKKQDVGGEAGQGVKVKMEEGAAGSVLAGQGVEAEQEGMGVAAGGSKVCDSSSNLQGVPSRQDALGLCWHDGSPCMAPSCAASMQLPPGGTASAADKQGVTADVARGVSSGFWKLAGLDIALDVFKQVAFVAGTSVPHGQQHPQMNVLHLGLCMPASSSEQQLGSEGCEGSASDYVLRHGGPANLPRRMWLLPGGPGSNQSLHPDRPGVKSEPGTCAAMDADPQPSLPDPGTDSQHHQQRQQPQDGTKGLHYQEEQQDGEGQQQRSGEELQSEGQVKTEEGQGVNQQALGKAEDSGQGRKVPAEVGQRQQPTSKVRGLQAALEAAPAGSSVNLVPWEYLDAGNPSTGAAEEQDAGRSVDRGVEEVLGGLMNEDSSIAVAAKVGQTHLAIGDISSSGGTDSLQLGQEDYAGSEGSEARAVQAVDGLMESEQATLYRMRLLWETATALRALVPGGCLILRLNDCLTNFTLSVLYVLHRSFEKLCIIKPFTSCAASSERLLVAFNRLNGDGCSGADMLLEVLNQQQHLMHTQQQQQTAQPKEVGTFVPPRLLTEASFFKYLYQRNIELAKHEARCLVAITARSSEPASTTANTSKNDTDKDAGRHGGASDPDHMEPGTSGRGLGSSLGPDGIGRSGVDGSGSYAGAGLGSRGVGGSFVQGSDAGAAEQGGSKGLSLEQGRAKVLEYAEQQLKWHLKAQQEAFEQEEQQQMHVQQRQQQQQQLMQQQQIQQQQMRVQQRQQQHGPTRYPQQPQQTPHGNRVPPPPLPNRQPHNGPPSAPYTAPPNPHLQQQQQGNGDSSMWMGELWVNANGSKKVCRITMNGKGMQRVNQICIMDYIERARLETLLQCSNPTLISTPNERDGFELERLCGYLAGHRGESLFKSSEKAALAELYCVKGDRKEIIRKAYLTVPNAAESISKGLSCWHIA